MRIYSRVTQQPAEEAVRLREEKVTVERRPADRPATDADFAAAGKEVIEMTETAEEPVVSKRARVVEEVVAQKEVTERTETVRGTERHTDVDVQREPETATETRRVTTRQDFATYAPVFRQHYDTAFGNKGGAYVEYEPAYKPCHDILSVSGYFRRLNADTRRTMCLSLRQERQQVYTGCDKHGFSTHNTLFFLVLCLNDNFLPISEALCKSSEVK